jgi:hypothetical protein
MVQESLDTQSTLLEPRLLQMGRGTRFLDFFPQSDVLPRRDALTASDGHSRDKLQLFGKLWPSGIAQEKSDSSVDT